MDLSLLPQVARVCSVIEHLTERNRHKEAEALSTVRDDLLKLMLAPDRQASLPTKGKR